MVNHNSRKPSKEKSLPAPNFNSLVISIASVAILKLGLEPNKKDEKDLALARHNIDLWKVKTKNKKQSQ